MGGYGVEWRYEGDRLIQVPSLGADRQPGGGGCLWIANDLSGVTVARCADAVSAPDEKRLQEWRVTNSSQLPGSNGMLVSARSQTCLTSVLACKSSRREIDEFARFFESRSILVGS